MYRNNEVDVNKSSAKPEQCMRNQILKITNELRMESSCQISHRHSTRAHSTHAHCWCAPLLLVLTIFLQMAFSLSAAAIPSSLYTEITAKIGKSNDLKSSQANIETNSIQRHVADANSNSGDRGGQNRSLKRVFLSNRTITCNDGSQAGFYLRKNPSSKKWIVFLEGGWHCYDMRSCRARWLRLRHLMTSAQWPETRDIGGILSPLPDENPYWHNANHVLVPYCSSDSWSGTRSVAETSDNNWRFMGALILRQVIADLIPLGLGRANGAELLLVGSSAGGLGVMLNLDRITNFLLHERHLMVTVRGVSDSGWFLDREPYTPSAVASSDAVRQGWKLWQGQVPDACAKQHSSEPWRCYYGYRLYPTLNSPLFVFQWLFDEAQMRADNVGAPVTPQQWNYIHEMGGALRSSLDNVTAVFAPSCIGHAVLSKRDWVNIKIDDISLPTALRCWEHSTRPRRKRHNKVKSKSKSKPKPTKRATEATLGAEATVEKRRHQNGTQRRPKNHNNRDGGGTNMDKSNNHSNDAHRNGHGPKPKRNRIRLTKEEREERKRRRHEQRQQRRKENRNRTRQRKTKPNDTDSISKEHGNQLPNMANIPNMHMEKSGNGMQELHEHRPSSRHRNNNNNNNNKKSGKRKHKNQQQRQQSRHENVSTDTKNLLEHQFQHEQPVQRSSTLDGTGSRFIGAGINGANNRRHSRIPRVPEKCSLRLLERCSWPQCNHSCPTLTNPLTGEEMRFLELLTSFGLDIEAVAAALGVDMHTLNNMDRTELVNLLTQQAS